MSTPTAFRAGDSATWTEDTPAHPSADGWVITFRLLFPSGTPASLTGTPTASGASFTASATTTANWPAGSATGLLYAERGSGAGLERKTLWQQAIRILPNLETATTLDGRSLAARALADLETALANYAASGRGYVESYDIAGRSMKFRNTKDILDLITYYKAEVNREHATAALLAGGSPGRVLVKL